MGKGSLLMCLYPPQEIISQPNTMLSSLVFSPGHKYTTQIEMTPLNESSYTEKIVHISPSCTIQWCANNYCRSPNPKMAGILIPKPTKLTVYNNYNNGPMFHQYALLYGFYKLPNLLKSPRGSLRELLKRFGSIIGPKGYCI